MSRSTSIEMFSAFFFVLLCLSPLATLASYHLVASGIIKSQAMARLSQCQRKGPMYLGECTMTREKDFANYLCEDSCAHLWCIYENINGERLCKDTGLPAENTPCGEYSVCHSGKCIWDRRWG